MVPRLFGVRVLQYGKTAEDEHSLHHLMLLNMDLLRLMDDLIPAVTLLYCISSIRTRHALPTTPSLLRCSSCLTRVSPTLFQLLLNVDDTPPLMRGNDNAATTDFSVRIAHKRSRLSYRGISNSTLATIAVIADWHDSRIQSEIDPPTKAAAAVVDMDGAVEGMKPLDGRAEEGAREGVA